MLIATEVAGDGPRDVLDINRSRRALYVSAWGVRLELRQEAEELRVPWELRIPLARQQALLEVHASLVIKPDRGQSAQKRGRRSEK